MATRPDTMEAKDTKQTKINDSVIDKILSIFFSRKTEECPDKMPPKKKK